MGTVKESWLSFRIHIQLFTFAMSCIVDWTKDRQYRLLGGSGETIESKSALLPGPPRATDLQRYPGSLDKRTSAGQNVANVDTPQRNIKQMNYAAE